MLIDVQYSSGHTEFPAFLDAVLKAEAEGADTVWVLDHFDGAMVGGDRPILGSSVTSATPRYSARAT